MKPTEPALRVITRRLREIMAEQSDGQARLDKIVQQIAGLMVAEVCSIYLRRQDGSLELFATEGLKRDAVHKTLLKRGEGLVGRCAELAIPMNEPDAQNHPAFSYRPETGEEVYHSLLAVPILRSGQLLGVLVVQNKTFKEYTEEDVEVLETTAMVVAEHLVSGAVSGFGVDVALDRSLSALIQGEVLSEGIALGHAVLHEPRVVVTELLAEDTEAEMKRLEAAVAGLKAALAEMLSRDSMALAGEHRDVLETFQMLANDRGWFRRLRDAVQEGLTAEAAVERVKNATRAQMLRQADPFWRERQSDLEELSDRLLRMLAGRSAGSILPADLPDDTILVARTMGPAELLDYDRDKLRGLLVEEGSGQSHVAIVAKALGIPAIGQADDIIERIANGDAIILDAEAGEAHLRPSADVIAAYADKVRFRARRQSRYAALKDQQAVTRDAQRIALQINAGLLVDLPHLAESGADGVGLFRTELQFMLASTFPRLEKQIDSYRKVMDAIGDKPVVFRTLDIGGDKVLPYMRQPAEENPAIGWRAIRMSLDRPGLFRTQVRALLRAADGRELRLMIPMIANVAEIDAARVLIDKELAIQKARGRKLPERLHVGAMIEVPSVLFDIDAIMRRVDFASVGSNDLLQFLFAADRNNPRVAKRFDALSLPALRSLKAIVAAAKRRRVPLNLCGEMAGRPLEAMALLGLGFRSISMAPASVGPVKAMILSLDTRRIKSLVDAFLESGTGSIRNELQRFAEADSIEI